MLRWRQIGNFKGKCSESLVVSSKMWSVLLRGPGGFSLHFCHWGCINPIIGRCGWRPSQQQWQDHYWLSGHRGLLSAFLGIFQVEFAFHSGFPGIRPDMLAGVFPVMGWKLWLCPAFKEQHIQALCSTIFGFLLWIYHRLRLLSVWWFNYHLCSVQL